MLPQKLMSLNLFKKCFIAFEEDYLLKLKFTEGLIFINTSST